MSSKRIIIDVRNPLEYASGHVEGALNIPANDLISGASSLENLDRETELVVYCRSGNRSNAFIQMLKQKGFTNLVNGINEEYVKKNYPIINT